MEEVCDGNSSETVSTDLLGNLLESTRDSLLLFCTLPSSSGSITTLLTVLLPLLFLLVATELATSKNVPGSEGHVEISCHGDNVTLEGAVQDVPSSSIDGEGGLAVINGVLVGLRHNPSGHVGSTKVKNLASLDEVMQRVHHFLDGGLKVPPVDVEDVDVVSAETSERLCDGNVHGLFVVSNVVDTLLHSGIDALVVSLRVLGDEDDLITDFALFHPLADDLFGLTSLAVERVRSLRKRKARMRHALVVGSIDEVSSVIEVRVQELFGALRRVGDDTDCLPTCTETHTTESDGRGMDGGRLSQSAVVAERGGRGRSWGPERHCS